jgi:DNA invertase Pin-like site-specific DNA recombinase
LTAERQRKRNGHADHRAALYHRVSTREQNPALARLELRQAARTRGLRVVLDVEETATGRDANRPGLSRVLDAVARGQVNAVIVQRLDRFGRSTLDLLANIRKLRTTGVTFHAIAQGLTVSPERDAVSELTLTILAAAAEFERTIIVERTLDGLAAARRAGKRLGRPPKKRRPTPAQVDELRQAGRTWPQIAAALKCSPRMAQRALDQGAQKR